MKIVREHINEKFEKDSDPIADMGIGSPVQYMIEKLFLEYFEKYKNIDFWHKTINGIWNKMKGAHKTYVFIPYSSLREKKELIKKLNLLFDSGKIHEVIEKLGKNLDIWDYDFIKARSKKNTTSFHTKDRGFVVTIEILTKKMTTWYYDQY